jgi:NADH-quinone oxidoreductase subunit L
MHLLWLVPALPLAGALALAILGGLLPRRAAGALGAGSVGLSWIVSLGVAGAYLSSPPAGGVFRQTLYTWVGLPGLQAPVGLYLDQLSLVLVSIVAFVSFLIHLYSVEHMRKEGDYSLFFCYLNLFVAFMLLLVLADNLLLFFLGWEGVGLCSYLLIGFWYRESANGCAAQKAFIITRIGDAALAVALFLLFRSAGSFDIQASVPAAGPAAGLVAALVLAAAVAKSAQLPLQTWLPDAMAGPTPVSALIHAATMVTAGVYLIARLHALFALSPPLMLALAVIGAATACYGGLCALAQRDIKRVLAYSTISQIGYMFVALGVGAWWAAIFHLVTHAFFKALLFLSAGMVVQAMDEQRDIFRMGGLWSRLPVAGCTFLIGALSLSALPLVTAGFYSKDAILSATALPPHGSRLLWGAGIAAAALTGIYIFRPFFTIFLGQPAAAGDRRPGLLSKLAVGVLAFFSITAGFVGMPPSLGGFAPLRALLNAGFGKQPATPVSVEAITLAFSSLASLAGILVAYLLYAQLRQRSPALARAHTFIGARAFLSLGLGFDWFYDRTIVRPCALVARANADDVANWLYAGIAGLARAGGAGLSCLQTGRVRNYATGLLFGAVLATFLLVLAR